jgi:hypothetical protein
MIHQIPFDANRSRYHYCTFRNGSSPPVAYYAMVPSLKLFLSRNLLETIPGAICELDTLTVLSLRNNNLRTIPAAIGKLSNLVELNLSFNKLRWLPYEILALVKGGKLRILSVHPNLFLEPEDFDDDQSTEPNEKSMKASHVTFLNIDGSRHSNSLPAPSRDYTLEGPYLLPVAPPNHKPLPPTLGRASGVPSLMEIALQACAQSPQLPQLDDLLPPDCPESLPTLLALARRVKTAGGQTCTMCKRSFIIPRTEWIEWWDCSPVSNASPRKEMPIRQEIDLQPNRVPLLRRGCSWRCCPTILNPTRPSTP